MLPRKLICHLRTPSITVDCRKGAGDDSSQNLVFRGQAFESINHETIRARHPLAPLSCFSTPGSHVEAGGLHSPHFSSSSAPPVEMLPHSGGGDWETMRLGETWRVGSFRRGCARRTGFLLRPSQVTNLCHFSFAQQSQTLGADLSSASQGAGRAATGKRAP